MSSIRSRFVIAAALASIDYAHRAGLRSEKRALDQLDAEKAKAELMTTNIGPIGHTRLPDVDTLAKTSTTEQRDVTNQAPESAQHGHLSRQQLRAAARAFKKAEAQRDKLHERIAKGARP